MLNRNPPAGGRDYSCNRPVRHPDESQDLRFLTLITILNQVQNDANCGCHPDENQNP
jgi:uncharacterized protein (UPF0147 family)